MAAKFKVSGYCHAHYLGEFANLPSNPRIPIYPPCSSDACLSIEYAKLIKSKLLLQLTGHGNARCAGTNDDDGIICVGILLVAVDSSYRFRDHLGDFAVGITEG